MTRTNARALAFSALSLAFLLIALIPTFRGGRLNVTFLALGVVFFVVSVAARRRPPASPGA